MLTDEVIRRLVRAALEIKKVSASKDQDIEWAYMKGPGLYRPVAAVSYGTQLDRRNLTQSARTRIEACVKGYSPKN